MNIQSPEQLKAIYDECDGNLELVAEKLGMSFSDFRASTALSLVPAPRQESPSRRAPPDALGNPNLRKYIISIRHAEHSTWPKKNQRAIEDARLAYEAGTHTMCQGRDRDWFIQYLIPLRVRVAPRQFFRMV